MYARALPGQPPLLKGSGSPPLEQHVQVGAFCAELLQETPDHGLGQRVYNGGITRLDLDLAASHSRVTAATAQLADEVMHKLRIIGRAVIPTRQYPDPKALMARLREEALALAKKHAISQRKIKALGISCGGPLDATKGIVLSPPNLPGWNNIKISDYFKNAFKVPVKLQNDANACALAEWKWGAGRSCRHMVFLTFGTGIGAGLILNGQLYEGANAQAGEAGHVRPAEDGPPVGHNKAGSFEGFCSGGEGLFHSQASSPVTASSGRSRAPRTARWTPLRSS